MGELDALLWERVVGAGAGDGSGLGAVVGGGRKFAIAPRPPRPCAPVPLLVVACPPPLVPPRVFVPFVGALCCSRMGNSGVPKCFSSKCMPSCLVQKRLGKRPALRHVLQSDGGPSQLDPKESTPGHGRITLGGLRCDGGSESVRVGSRSGVPSCLFKFVLFELLELLELLEPPVLLEPPMVSEVPVPLEPWGLFKVLKVFELRELLEDCLACSPGPCRLAAAVTPRDSFA